MKSAANLSCRILVLAFLTTMLGISRVNTSAQPTNDAFSGAHVLKGVSPPTGLTPLTSATEELGEPVHIPSVQTKSVWWKWQAPNHGNLYVSRNGGTITNVVITVFKGKTLETLAPLAKGTNDARFSIFGGENLYIAAAVPTNVVGDTDLLVGYDLVSTSVRVVPGNLLKEPSWEGTGLNPQFWQKSGSIGGYVGAGFGVDGTTWPVLATDAAIWQDIATVPGHEYQIRFAFGISGCCGNVGVRTYWNSNDLGILYNWVDEPYWHWSEFIVTASNTTSRVLFKNIHQSAHMDAFSVVDLSAPPTIVKQPSSVSSFVGGSAAFIVGVNGSSPLHYQWLRDGASVSGATNHTLFLSALTEEEAGNYTVVITNTFGSSTSALASLVIEAPTNATIVVQPYSDILPAGSYFNFSVIARGQAPLSYQWFKDSQELQGATNRNFSIPSIQSSDTGEYHVRVQNPWSSVQSLKARLTVTSSNSGGGEVVFWNKFPFGQTNIATVFDVDGATPLSGAGYVAQLYAGPSIELLRAVGQPSPFLTNLDAGIFTQQIITLPNVAPGETVVAQVRAWVSADGASYEEARALGGRFGRSGPVMLTAGGGATVPARMIGLQSFQLQTGLPQFSAGIVSFLQQQPDGIFVWSLEGEPGFLYLVERSLNVQEVTWNPFKVVTNTTGAVTFSDTNTPSASVVLYRGRILD